MSTAKRQPQHRRQLIGRVGVRGGEFAAQCRPLRPFVVKRVAVDDGRAQFRPAEIEGQDQIVHGVNDSRLAGGGQWSVSQ